MKLYAQIIKSPLGPIHAVATDKALVQLCFSESGMQAEKRNQTYFYKKNKVLALAEKQLKEYFAGKRKKFTVPLSPAGTEFQNKAWKALLEIPFGGTLSYFEQARKIRSPQACRAIGSANGKNPICILIPCHRVIAKSGKLGGYSGGLEIKKSLLKLEGINF